ncbi:hypothetical protein LCI18_003731 [Fusarium solani-melongenae]|uniref:Uncharacterized protein n=1 Tax=Fusarium solani subsp. cucurbitae TaxID=2747967 RepID=A0ACD3YW12_FUSSC|nr:hypothetical protein LCI18_003731 [Fusarium solani-melongenae]
MNEQDYIDLMNTINAIMGPEPKDDIGSGAVELASFYIDFPEAEMSMNLAWPVKLEGPISYDYLIEKYEKAVKNLEKYRRNINAWLDYLAREDDTFSTESKSAAELTERLMKEKQHVQKRIYAIYDILDKVKEQADDGCH